MLLSCLKSLQCIAFSQCVLYLLPLCLNRDLRGLSVGAVQGLLCQPPLAVQKLCIPASLQPCWSSRFQHSEKRKQNELFLWFGKFLFPASFSCQDVGSQVFTLRCPAEVPSQRYRSICLSVRIIITAKLHIWSGFKAVLYIRTAFWKCWDIYDDFRKLSTY